jgi:hypothetical protein
MAWETYNFTSDFQDALFACLIRHPDEFWIYGEIVKPEYFTGAAAAELMFRYKEYVQKYKEYPTFTTLGNYAWHQLLPINAARAKEVLDYVAKLAKIPTHSRKAILDLAIKFARERAVFEAIRKIHAAQVDGKGDSVDPVRLMQEALSVGVNFNDLGYSLYHDSSLIIDRSMSKDYGVLTGYAPFDNLWKTGWCAGWLVVLLAPPKGYKSAMSINLAVNIARAQDADVLYYACEISQELAALRAICSLTGWTRDNFFEQPEKGKLLTKEVLKKELWGNIWFKGYPSKGVTISQIRAHAHSVIDLYGLKPRAIIIDYAETVRPDSVSRDLPDWRQQADIYVQARALGSELGCCVIMPDRCNRETVGRAVPDAKSFQGSFEKAGIVDVAIGLCATEKEHIHNRIRYFVFLNRHGEQYKHYEGQVDPERMRMTVNREIEYVPEESSDRPKYRRNHSGASNTWEDSNAEITQSEL